MRRFWQGCWSARSVVVVEVNGYTIEPGADLSGVDFRQANLSGADLTGADLEGVNLELLLTNEDTVWPEGFDPVAAGVIFED